MISTRKDRIEEWLRVPVTKKSRDPRFDIRRVLPSEYERIYDLVDVAFERRRSRREFDWLYRDNPTGSARCWVVVAKETGAFVCSEALFPWPISRGDELLEGVMLGDSVTHPDWQHQRIPRQRARMRSSHPWIRRTVGFSDPNWKSRNAMIKHGRGQFIAGPMPAAAFGFRTRVAIERRGWPRALAGPVGLAADAALRGFAAFALRADVDASLEPVQRFDSDFNSLTERCMWWPRFWCPHDASFLNWRYLDHPTHDHIAYALIERGRPIGYFVLRLDSSKATLLEFVVDSEPRTNARALLARAIRVARDAGCPYLAFYAPEAWRHWQLLRRSGFLPYRSNCYLSARGGIYEPEVCDLDNWQLVPGDSDYR